MCVCVWGGGGVRRGRVGEARNELSSRPINHNLIIRRLITAPGGGR